MTIARQTITLQRGDDESVLIKVLYPDKQRVNLSDVRRVDLHVRVDTKRVIARSSEDGIDVTEKHKGELLINFPHELTQEAAWYRGEYDLQLTFNSGRVKTILRGEVHLTRDVTVVPGDVMSSNRLDNLEYCQVIEVVITSRKPAQVTDDEVIESGINIPDFKFIIDLNML